MSSNYTGTDQGNSPSLFRPQPIYFLCSWNRKISPRIIIIEIAFYLLSPFPLFLRLYFFFFLELEIREVEVEFGRGRLGSCLRLGSRRCRRVSENLKAALRCDSYAEG
jgi:hypothetical protein